MSNKSTQGVRHKKRNKYAAPIGATFILLALVGLISIVYISMDMTSKIFDKSAQMAKFESYIMPVLMFDPVPFESVDKADENMVLQSSIWACLMSDKRETYSYDDGGMLLLPASDVEVNAAKLFGSTIKITHHTFGDYEMTYYYNDETKTYQVPIMVQTGFYRPKVEDISKKGNVITLRVGYIPPGDSWSTDLTGKTQTPTADKYMMYVMEELKKDNYKILAIQDPPENISNDVKNSSITASGGK